MNLGRAVALFKRSSRRGVCHVQRTARILRAQERAGGPRSKDHDLRLANVPRGRREGPPQEGRPNEVEGIARAHPHDALLGEIRVLGAFDIAPKKGYLSLSRRKQFAMVQPSTASRIDLGLILPATMPTTGRLESAAKFNPLFTHRVRITAASELDEELRGWLATAYALAG